MDYRNLDNNIEYSEEWLTMEILRLHEKERKENKVDIIRMKKIDLLRLVQKFIKLNKRGE